MATSKLLVWVLIVLGIFSGVAAMLKTENVPVGKTPLIWVSDNNPARAAQIGAFNQENPDLYLSLDYSNLGIQKVILQCSSGVGPDIFDIYNAAELQAYVEAGVVWDVTESLSKGGFNATGSNTWSGMRENLRYQGRQYAYPGNSGVSLLIYNKNVFDFLGLSYPEGIITWEQFVKLGLQIRQLTDPAHPIYAVTGLEWMTFFEGQRGEFFAENGDLHLADSPELIRAFQMHKDMLYKYRIMPSSMDLKAMSGQGGWGAGALNQFSAGRFAMAISGEWALVAFGRTYQRQIQDLAGKRINPEEVKNPLDRPLKLGCVLIPKFEGSLPSYGVGGRMTGVNARSPRREQALRFLQYLAGPTYSRLLNQSADNLPGNPHYADSGIEPGPDALARMSMHEATVKGMEYGYSKRKSPFLLGTDVIRVLKVQISRMESNPDLHVEDLLKDAQAELETLIQRNLSHDPDLRKLYTERFGSLPKS